MARIISMQHEFITEGEAKTAQTLKGLPDNWVVICNKIVTTNQGKGYEVDFIIVATNWIFVLDEKSWRGSITGNDTYWQVGDLGSIPSPFQKLEYIARILRSYLDRYNSRFKLNGRYVQGGVVLSSQERSPAIIDPRAQEGVFCLDDICSRLIQLDKREGNPIIGQCIPQIIEVLAKLSARHVLPARINQYTINSAEQIHDGMRKLYAQTDDGQNRVVMLYDLGVDPLERTALRSYYLHEYETLRTLEKTGIVPKAHDYFEWEERFLACAYTPMNGVPLATMPYPYEMKELKVCLKIASSAFKSLGEIHKHKILHRAISPTHVVVISNNVAFTDFYAARKGSTSVADTLDRFALSAEDPYAHPDLAVSYGFATPETDCFSLALVFLERITGQTIRVLQEHIKSGGDLRALFHLWMALPAETVADLVQTFQTIVETASQQHADLSAAEIAQRFQFIAQHISQEDDSPETITFANNSMHIERLLGHGQFSETYLASYASIADHPQVVFKRLLHPEWHYRQCEQEFRALEKLKSPYFPGIRKIYPESERYHIEMEYIPGSSLLALESTFPWSIERWRRLAEHTLNALAYLEDHHIVHRDIKLENIILNEDDAIPVFIDFGFAYQGEEPQTLQGSPLYLPPEMLRGESIGNAQDRYAACMVLFKVLTGIYPRTTDKEKLIELQELSLPPIEMHVAHYLLDALQDDPQQRPQDVSALRKHLMDAFVQPATFVAQNEDRPLARLINPWVHEMRSLYRNSVIGNGENRGLDSPTARSTYIPTRLDTIILPNIFTYKPHLLFLSGNPGDGKTAFIAQVKHALQERGAREIWSDTSGWEYELDGHRYRSCYDASEAAAGKSADQQLAAKLTGLEGTTQPDIRLTVLVAINDGRQLDFFERNKETYHWVRQAVQAFTDNPDLQQHHVWMLDLKERALVDWPGQHSIADDIIAQFVSDERWQVCHDCAAQSVCPLYQNAQALRKPQIRARLDSLLLLVHLRKQYHLTMRDIRSAIAYIVAGDTGCESVHASVQSKEFTQLAALRYWNLAFADEPVHEAVIQQIALLDPGILPHPVFDRLLHYHSSQEYAPMRRSLFLDATDLSLLAMSSNDERMWMKTFKRKYYFEASETTDGDIPEQSLPTPEALLPYAHAHRFIALLRDVAASQQESLRDLARGLVISDNVLIPLDDTSFNVVIKASEQHQFLVLKQFPLAAFQLKVRTSKYHDVFETIADTLILEDRRMHRLLITLDLFELLMRMQGGQLPRSREFQPLLDELTRFKRRLQLEDATELTIVDRATTIYRMRERDGAIVIEGAQ